MTDMQLVPGEWPTSIWDVTRPDVCFCIQALCCPCIQYAANMQLLYAKAPAVAPCSGSYFFNCMHYWMYYWGCLLIGCPPMPCCIHSDMRQKMARLNNIEPECVDSLYTSLLSPCAIIQEYNLIIRLPDIGQQIADHKHAINYAKHMQNHAMIGGNVQIAQSTPVYAVAQVSYPNQVQMRPPTQNQVYPVYQGQQQQIGYSPVAVAVGQPMAQSNYNNYNNHNKNSEY